MFAGDSPTGGVGAHMTVRVQPSLHAPALHGRLRAAGLLRSLGGALWGSLIRAVALVAVLLLSGCGGGGSDGDGDPASAVPADALLYAELVVRPDGSLREDALDAAGKVLRTEDPEARVRELMREAFAGADVDFERDVEPWLGERAGFWLGRSRARDDAGLLLVEAADVDVARDSIRESLERGGGTVGERSHRDTDYLVSSESVAAGIVGDFAAFGREADLRRTIDAFEGESLAGSGAYARAVDGLEDERLAHFWVDTRRLAELAASRAQAGALLPFDSLRPLAGAFAADGERLTVEVRSEGGDQVLGPWFAAGATPLVRELPADAWVAGGTADAGAALRSAIDGVAGAFGGIAVRRQLQRESGLDLDRDLLDWIGDTAFFVRGATPVAMEAGLVIQPSDESRAADAFGRLVGAIQRALEVDARPVDISGADQAFALRNAAAPRPIVLARGAGLVVATFGLDAAEAALAPGDRLGDTEEYAEAEALVGMEPSLLVSMPDVLELADAAGAGGEPDFIEIRPYLEAVGVIAAGAAADGEGATSRVAAGLR